MLLLFISKGQVSVPGLKRARRGKLLLIWGQLPVAPFCRGGWLLWDLAHLCAGLVKLKLSPQDVFSAANPHAKGPGQIQECCLNPGLDTATSMPPPYQLQQHHRCQRAAWLWRQ